MDWIDSLLSDPRTTLIFFLLALPGRMLAISAHEAAHAWVADRCGDPTARYMGRITLNPLKHLDPVGILCMLVLGIGWAKPVPVNPLNFRKYRRDDLLVSIAGVTMNLILFIVSAIGLYAVIAAALFRLPVGSLYYAKEEIFRSFADGVPVLVNGEYYYLISQLLCVPGGLSEILITPVFGSTAGYLYEMLYYLMATNLMLAIFNLIPVPPLDGYHVLNDLVLKRPLFADGRAQGLGMGIMYLLMFTGFLSKALGWAGDMVYTGVSAVAMTIFRGIGLF